MSCDFYFEDFEECGKTRDLCAQNCSDSYTSSDAEKKRQDLMNVVKSRALPGLKCSDLQDKRYWVFLDFLKLVSGDAL